MEQSKKQKKEFNKSDEKGEATNKRPRHDSNIENNDKKRKKKFHAVLNAKKKQKVLKQRSPKKTAGEGNKQNEEETVAISIPESMEDLLQGASSNWKKLQQTLPPSDPDKKKKVFKPKLKAKKPETKPTKEPVEEKKPVEEPIPMDATSNETNAPKQKTVVSKCMSIACDYTVINEMRHESASNRLLSRVAIADFSGDIIYDKAVPSDMAEFKTIQGEVAKILEKKLVVGYEVKDSFGALMLPPPTNKMIREIATFYPLHDPSPKPLPLRRLAQIHLPDNTDLLAARIEKDVIAQCKISMLLYKKCHKEWELFLQQGKQLQEVQSNETNAYREKQRPFSRPQRTDEGEQNDRSPRPYGERSEQNADRPARGGRGNFGSSRGGSRGGRDFGGRGGDRGGSFGSRGGRGGGRGSFGGGRGGFRGDDRINFGSEREGGRGGSRGSPRGGRGGGFGSSRGGRGFGSPRGGDRGNFGSRGGRGSFGGGRGGFRGGDRGGSFGSRRGSSRGVVNFGGSGGGRGGGRGGFGGRGGRGKPQFNSRPQS